MKTQMKLTDLQTKVLAIIMTAGEIYIGDIAKKLYKNVRSDLRPQDMNNSVVCVIKQINKKTPGHIKGVNRGCKGKLIYL